MAGAMPAMRMRCCTRDAHSMKSGVSSRYAASSFNAHFLAFFLECLNDLIHISIQYLLNIMEFLPDAMVSNAVYGKVVGPYLFRTVSGANLFAAGVGDVA